MADKSITTRRAALLTGIGAVFSTCAATASMHAASPLRAAWDGADVETRSAMKGSIIEAKAETLDDVMLQAEAMQHCYAEDRFGWLYGYRKLVDNMLALRSRGAL
jgi:hypothetical protein